MLAKWFETFEWAQLQQLGIFKGNNDYVVYVHTLDPNNKNYFFVVS